ncbi:hypothetical protein C479_04052 [Halovivax asiaticus JCM 14624]|uniref:HNH endonuclease 5 domain-containing protein n=1 Tax=Halovivax asiaticus JCM 14624 TaxID=1227490 RepID=M0BR16_9EURY|nr:HNH endonuclease [Halovivax asiaticus]ELZ12537.1 hypothetical protein C479_04052 [Halovivax asiaticus JCM 14624]
MIDGSSIADTATPIALAVLGGGLLVGGYGLVAGPGGSGLSFVWGGLVVLSALGIGALGWRFLCERDTDEPEQPIPTPPLPDPLRREVRDERADGNCEFCRTESDSLSVEHVTPRADGGANVRTNLVALCPACVEKVGDGVYARSELRDAVRRQEHPEKTML